MKSPRYRAILKAKGLRAFREGRNSIGVKSEKESCGITDMDGEKMYLIDFLKHFSTPIHQLMSPCSELKNMYGSNPDQ